MGSFDVSKDELRSLLCEYTMWKWNIASKDYTSLNTTFGLQELKVISQLSPFHPGEKSSFM